MSKYSGRCDFYDLILSVGLKKVLETDIFVENDPSPDIKLVVHRKEDLIPFFPHGVILATWYKNDSKILLTRESLMDIEKRIYRPIELISHQAYREEVEKALRNPETIQWKRNEGYHAQKQKV